MQLQITYYMMLLPNASQPCSITTLHVYYTHFTSFYAPLAALAARFQGDLISSLVSRQLCGTQNSTNFHRHFCKGLKMEWNWMLLKLEKMNWRNYQRLWRGSRKWQMWMRYFAKYWPGAAAAWAGYFEVQGWEGGSIDQAS